MLWLPLVRRRWWRCSSWRYEVDPALRCTSNQFLAYLGSQEGSL
jgi:hypothetical protein